MSSRGCGICLRKNTVGQMKKDLRQMESRRVFMSRQHEETKVRVRQQ